MNIKQKIHDTVTGSPVVLYMKGTQQAPQCGFSARAIQILQACGVKNLVTVDVLADPDVRQLFTRENLLASEWYAARLKAKQAVDRQLWQRHVDYLDRFVKRASHADESARLGIPHRLTHARHKLAEVDSPTYLKTLVGTLGTEPIEAYL